MPPQVKFPRHWQNCASFVYAQLGNPPSEPELELDPPSSEPELELPPEPLLDDPPEELPVPLLLELP
jgi:hypothetical protein